MKKIIKLTGYLFVVVILAIQPVFADVVQKYGGEASKSSPYHVYSYPDMIVVNGIPMIKVTSWLNSKYSDGRLVHEYDSMMWDAETKTLDIYQNKKPYQEAAHVRIKAGDNYVYYSGRCTTTYNEWSKYPGYSDWAARRTPTSYHCRVPNQIINGSLYMDADAIEMLLTIDGIWWYEEGKSIAVGA